MIKKWVEYITENVDPEKFNSIIYIRNDNGNEQFWIYVKLNEDQIGTAFYDNSVLSEILNEILPDSMTQRISDYGTYLEDDFEYVLSIANCLNISQNFVYGVSYSENEITQNFIEYFKNIKNTTLVTWMDYLIPQIQMVSIESKGHGIDFDVIDYYI